MSLAAPELARLIYHSPHVSVCEINYQAPYGPCQYRLQTGSMVFIRSGLFAARIADRDYIVDANHVVFGGDCDELVAINAAKTACTCTALQYSSDGRIFPREAALCAPSAYLLHARLVNAVRLARSESAIEELASCLALHSGSDSYIPPIGSEQHGPTVSAIKEIVNHPLSKPVSLFELANRFYVSPFTISRWFHADTGISLRLYIQRLRLRRALIYMLDERRSMTAIAIELGFYDEPRFSKAFHAEFGVAPAMSLTAS